MSTRPSLVAGRPGAQRHLRTSACRPPRNSSCHSGRDSRGRTLLCRRCRERVADRFRRAAESNRSIRSCCERCAANPVTDVRASDRHWFGAVRVVEPDANGIAGRRHSGDHADRRVRDAVLTQCLLRGAPRSDPSRIRRLSRYRWRGPERCEQHGACGRGQTDSDHP